MSWLISYDIQDGHHIAMVAFVDFFKEAESKKSKLDGAGIRAAWRFKIMKLILSDCQHATLATIMKLFKRQLQDYNIRPN